MKQIPAKFKKGDLVRLTRKFVHHKGDHFLKLIGIVMGYEMSYTAQKATVRVKVYWNQIKIFTYLDEYVLELIQEGEKRKKMTNKISSQQIKDLVDKYLKIDIYDNVINEQIHRNLAKQWWDEETYPQAKGFEKFYKRLRKAMQNNDLQEV